MLQRFRRCAPGISERGGFACGSKQLSALSVGFFSPFSCRGGLSSQVQHLIESNFIGSFPAKTFSWPEIKCSNKPADIFIGKCGYFTSLGNKLADQAVCVFVGGSFPGRSGMSIKHINSQLMLHLHILHKLCALVKGNTADR